MAAEAGLAVIGIILIVLGAANMRGNIASIHWYHRKRVSEEDKKPFGRLMGLGTLVIGGAMIVSCGLNVAAEKFQCAAFQAAGAVLLTASIIFGLGISFYAMIKYNKGIF